MKILILTLFILIGVGCSQHVKDDILLQIGDYKLTVAEYEFIRNSARYKQNSDEQLQNILIEEGRLIAYALEHKYDTIEILNKQLDYATYYYASKVDGYVWNKKVKPLLIVSENDIQKAYHMRSNEYHLDFICFPNKQILRKYYKSDYPLESEKVFFSVQKKISSDLNVRSYSHYMRYPFYPIGCYTGEILKAEVGDVLGPFETSNGYYMIRVGTIKNVPSQSYERERAIISQELQNGLKEKYIWESQQQIIRNTSPKMYEEAIYEVASKVNIEKKEWQDINCDLILMEYDLNGIHYHYTVADFIEFAHCEPLYFGSLSNPDDVKKMLNTHLTNVFLFAEAQQLRMEEDEEYQQFKNRYQHSILLNHYKQKNIYPNILIQDKEIVDYYHSSQNNFKCFESASVIVYHFKDIHDAMKGRKQILSEPEGLKNMVIVKKENDLFVKADGVDFEVEKSNYDKNFIDIILRLNIGQISNPFKVGNEYQIVRLISKSGIITTPLKYVKDEIKQKLSVIKEQEITHQQVQELQNLYPITVNRLKKYSSTNKVQ